MKPRVAVRHNAYGVAEWHLEARPYRHRPNGTEPAVVACHGRVSTLPAVPAFGIYGADLGEVPLELADAGFVIGAPEQGGNKWGNDPARNSIGTMRTHLQGATIGAKAGKIGIYAGSMGFLPACRYAVQNPANVAAIAGVIPLTHLIKLAERNYGGFAAEIYNAHGVANQAGLVALAGSIDPIELADELAAASIELKLWRASDDPATFAADVDAFAAAAGADVVDLGPGGHTSANIDPAEVTAFLQEALA